jgi:hypothetical protein
MCVISQYRFSIFEEHYKRMRNSQKIASLFTHSPTHFSFHTHSSIHLRVTTVAVAAAAATKKTFFSRRIFFFISIIHKGKVLVLKNL